MKILRPSALRSRRLPWTIPEGAFQKELYRCLFEELGGILIWAEHKQDSHGNIDFLLPARRESIEILQNGTDEQMLEHALRGAPSGMYSNWGIIDNYICINFCYPTLHRDLRNTSKIAMGISICSRELQLTTQ